MNLLNLKIEEDEKYQKENISIQCSKVTEKIQEIVSFVKQFDSVMEVQFQNRTQCIDVKDIFYIETVDRKTFVYTKNEVYACSKSLIELEKELSFRYFVRISKTTILNMKVLDSVEPYVNHRLKANIANGETLIVSRTYIQNIKDYFITRRK